MCRFLYASPTVIIIFIGGYSILAQDYVTRVWKFNGVSWNVVGYTAVARSNYRTVLVNDVAFTAGGFGEKNNEKWTFDKAESLTLETSFTNILFPELIPIQYLTCA